VRKDTGGNGAYPRNSPAKYALQTLSKTKDKGSVFNVLTRPSPYLSLKSVTVQVDYLGWRELYELHFSR